MKNNKNTQLSIRPLSDRVVIRPHSLEDKKSPSGIIIPDTVSKEKPEQGKVVAVGEGRVDDNGKVVVMKVKVGDSVLFSKYGYDEVKIEGVEYYILKEENILAIIK
jgi:chaperonin GroES